MQVIFLKDVPRVGRRHDVKEVNGGYAMNFLFPQKLAEPATPKALLELQMRRNKIVVEREVQEDLLLRSLEEIKGKVVHMESKADDKGHLFKGISAKEIATALLAEHRASIEPEYIILEKPIKSTGEFEIPISIKNKKSSFKLLIEKI
jgi:large subunit ribosomal protein L9